MISCNVTLRYRNTLLIIIQSFKLGLREEKVMSLVGEEESAARNQLSQLGKGTEVCCLPLTEGEAPCNIPDCRF